MSDTFQLCVLIGGAALLAVALYRNRTAIYELIAVEVMASADAARAKKTARVYWREQFRAHHAGRLVEINRRTN